MTLFLTWLGLTAPTVVVLIALDAHPLLAVVAGAVTMHIALAVAR